MDNSIIGLLVFAVAFLTSLFIFPLAMRFAVKHNIVDNPNARKLQRSPVPVFGGVVVYAGILVGTQVLWLFMPSDMLQWGIMAMTIMLLIGIWDDIKDISVALRFLIEILMVGTFITLTGLYIDGLSGLWGIEELSPWLGIPFSIFVGVGIINAINMIDGVDGYSSGYGMLSCACLALAFYAVWDPKMVCMALIVIGALLPFFMHNVFGQYSRMYIGDGGTLMLGMVLVTMAFYSLSSNTQMDHLDEKGICVPAFILAVGSIPIFDTLRVMSQRMMRGRSPFKPDKTHLHHLFIDMRFSHLGASLCILAINLMVVFFWYLTWLLGASLEVQMYVVIALGTLVTFGLYFIMRKQQNGGPVDEEGYPLGTRLWHKMCHFGEWTHKENKRSWRFLSYIMDGPMQGRGIIK